MRTNVIERARAVAGPVDPDHPAVAIVSAQELHDSLDLVLQAHARGDGKLYFTALLHFMLGLEIACTPPLRREDAP